jgi:fructoselysine-6-P-deglycase FrlB-like protein
VASVTAEGSGLASVSDICLEMPWVSESSNFGTRSYTNLFLSNLFNTGILAGDAHVIDDIKTVTDEFEDFIGRWSEPLREQAAMPFERVLVLADGVLNGIAGVGAESLRAVGGVPSWRAHIIDTRYSHKSLIDDKTLIIVAAPPQEDVHLGMCLNELTKRGAKLITLTDQDSNDYKAQLNIQMPKVKTEETWGFGLLFCLNAIAYYRSIEGKTS